jgi:hypothetical protein
MRKFFISLAITLVVIVVAIFVFRHQILRYSAEAVIRKALPDYIRIETIAFEADKRELTLSGFAMLNPPGFSDRYLVEIDRISCRYRLKGKTVLDGIEVLEPLFKKPVFHIERLKDGRLNLNEAAPYFEKRAAPKTSQKAAAEHGKIPSRIAGMAISDIIKLPENFTIEGGKLVFLDREPYRKPHLITFENIEARLTLALDESYSRILRLSSTGEGFLNGEKNEIIRWNTSLNPTTPRLTMSNRFDVSNVSLLPLEPYYDHYSPLAFKSGCFSGTLVFDFDNGNIGSTNEIRLSGIAFRVKGGYENAVFWQTTVPDLVKYLTSSSGEIIFDFKIKGDMAKPKFYLGPVTKQALAAMAIDKVSDAVLRERGSDIEKAKEYVDMFKGLLNKK